MSAAARRLLPPETLARVEGLQLRVRQPVAGAQSGQHASLHRGVSVEFQEHKEYSPGDEVRHIDWKAYGRMDRYYVKQFEQESSLRAYFVLDASGSMSYPSDEGPTKLDAACELVAALAHMVLRQQDAAGLVMVRDGTEQYIPPRCGSYHQTVLLEALRDVQGAGSTDLVRSLSQVAELARRRSLVVVASDLLDFRPGVLQLLRQLRSRRHEVVVLHVLHPNELEFPFREWTRFEDLESEEFLMADPRGMRLAYLEELRQFLERTRGACREADIDYVLVDTARPTGEVIAEFLGRRRR